jgi:hypothetical protein
VGTTGRRALVTALAVGAALVAAAPGASAQTPAVPVLVGTSPALPPAVSLQVRATDLGADEIVAVNPTPVPLVVTGPDGADFLRVSAAGVETNAASGFTTTSRSAPDRPRPVPAGVGGPPRWTPVSSDVSWRWFDPRLRPALTAEPGGGRDDVVRTVGRWLIALRYGDTPVTADGRVELRPTEGWFRAVAAPAPAGTAVVVTDGAPPGLRLQAPAGLPVTVLGLDGEDFLRRTPDGRWEASADSRTYRSALVAAGRPVPGGSGWVPYSGAGSVGWTDERLRPPADVGTDARSGGRSTSGGGASRCGWGRRRPR